MVDAMVAESWSPRAAVERLNEGHDGAASAPPSWLAVLRAGEPASRAAGVALSGVVGLATGVRAGLLYFGCSRRRLQPMGAARGLPQHTRPIVRRLERNIGCARESDESRLGAECLLRDEAGWGLDSRLPTQVRTRVCLVVVARERGSADGRHCQMDT